MRRSFPVRRWCRRAPERGGILDHGFGHSLSAARRRAKPLFAAMAVLRPKRQLCWGGISTGPVSGCRHRAPSAASRLGRWVDRAHRVRRGTSSGRVAGIVGGLRCHCWLVLVSRHSCLFTHLGGALASDKGASRPGKIAFATVRGACPFCARPYKGTSLEFQASSMRAWRNW